MFGRNAFSLNTDYFMKRHEATANRLLVKVISTTANFPLSKIPDEQLVFMRPNTTFGMDYDGRLYTPNQPGQCLLRKQINKDSPVKRPTISAAESQRYHTIFWQDSDLIFYNYLAELPPVLDAYEPIMRKHGSIEAIHTAPFTSSRVDGGPILNALLAEYIGEEVLIPYDMEARRQLYSRAFDELAAFF